MVESETQCALSQEYSGTYLVFVIFCISEYSPSKHSMKVTMVIWYLPDNVTIVGVKPANMVILRIIHQYSTAAHIIMEWNPVKIYKQTIFVESPIPVSVKNNPQGSLLWIPGSLSQMCQWNKPHRYACNSSYLVRYHHRTWWTFLDVHEQSSR